MQHVKNLCNQYSAKLISKSDVTKQKKRRIYDYND